MHSFWSEYGLFALKSLTLFIIFISFLVVTLIIIGIAKSQKYDSKGDIQIKSLNEQLTELKNELLQSVGTKQDQKAFKQYLKQNAVQISKSDTPQPRLFVTYFNGDLQASAVESLREVITAILLIAKPVDQVLVVLESAGGMVHSYGLAASQLSRLREHKITFTAAVDRVAASGGYMMACVADKIVAAPFAIVGSIGVFAQVPNFNRFLKDKKIDIEQHTAGEYKATLTMLGEVTDKQRQKFDQELAETHDLFKQFITDFRPNLDINKLATGEHWYGKQAIGLGLIDDITTSDDFILKHLDDWNIVEVKFVEKQPIKKRLFNLFANLSQSINSWASALNINSGKLQ